MAKLRIAQAARNDLRDIRIYSKSAFGALVAREYLEGLRGVFTMLRDRPFAGVVDDDLGDAMRSFVHRSHRIYIKSMGKGY